jgi:ribosomal protein S18 acetylase RimI-like enzyme
MPLEISLAHLSDIPTISDLAHVIWPVTFAEILSPKQIDYMLDMMYSEAAILDQMNSLNHVLLLGKEDGKAVGYISYELNYKGQTKTKIHKIYLLSETQGKGYGAKLMNEVNKIARENKQSSLTLNVNKYNKALSFYHKLGFETIGNEDIDIGNGYLMEDAILEKQI